MPRYCRVKADGFASPGGGLHGAYFSMCETIGGIMGWEMGTDEEDSWFTIFINIALIVLDPNSCWFQIFVVFIASGLAFLLGAYMRRTTIINLLRQKEEWVDKEKMLLNQLWAALEEKLESKSMLQEARVSLDKVKEQLKSHTLALEERKLKEEEYESRNRRAKKLKLELEVLSSREEELKKELKELGETKKSTFPNDPVFNVDEYERSIKELEKEKVLKSKESELPTNESQIQIEEEKAVYSQPVMTENMILEKFNKYGEIIKFENEIKEVYESNDKQNNENTVPVYKSKEDLNHAKDLKYLEFSKTSVHKYNITKNINQELETGNKETEDDKLDKYKIYPEDKQYNAVVNEEETKEISSQPIYEEIKISTSNVDENSFKNSEIYDRYNVENPKNDSTLNVYQSENKEKKEEFDNTKLENGSLQQEYKIDDGNVSEKDVYEKFDHDLTRI